MKIFSLSRIVAIPLAAAVLFAGSLVSAVPAAAGEDIGSMVRGALLYDKWFKVIGAEKPAETHPAWPAANTKKKGNTTWRCKSCHGWDLRGKDGAYSSGSYDTGIVGVRAYENADPAKIVAIIKDATHRLDGMMDEKDYNDIAMFVSKGQVDMTKYIAADKSVEGDLAKGKDYYVTLCQNCHGAEGRKPKELPKPLGKIASGNPWETLHKIYYGQPGEGMPALRALPLQVTLDVLAYTISMPQE